MIAKLEFDMDDPDDARAFRMHRNVGLIHCAMILIRKYIRDWENGEDDAVATLHMIQEKMREINIAGMD